MERNKDIKLLLILILAVGVVTLSIGFAAFSNVLTIKQSATVTPDESSFDVDFSSSETSVETNEIIPVLTPASLQSTNATIDNSSDPTISNLSVTFTEPGQKVVYTFYAYNNGELDAYLKSIIYANVLGNTSNKVCTALTGTTDAYVQSACDGIVVKTKVGDENETTSGTASITNHLLSKKTSELITISIEYLANSERADGDFTVSFGDISLNYSSVD